MDRNRGCCECTTAGQQGSRFWLSCELGQKLEYGELLIHSYTVLSYSHTCSQAAPPLLELLYFFMLSLRSAGTVPIYIKSIYGLFQRPICLAHAVSHGCLNRSINRCAAEPRGPRGGAQ